MMSDVRTVCRRLSETPIVTAAILLSLGLGIGVTTTIFSLVNALLLRPLPVHDPKRLVTLSSNLALSHGLTTGLGWNHPIWLRMQERAGLFDGALAWVSADVSLRDHGVARALFTSGTFFPVLGVEAHRGRVYLPTDDIAGGGLQGPVGVISDQFWRRRFDRDPAAIGSVLTLGQGAITIIGVTREDFTGVELGRSFDVAVPFGAEPGIRGDQSTIARPEQFLLTFMLRLKGGQSPAAAEAALAAIQSGLSAGDNLPRFLEEPIRLVPAGTGADRHRLRWSYQQPLLAVFLAAAFTLLVACANIASLMLARAAARAHELSVRMALGASRARMARHLLIESAVLASIGMCTGAVFAWWASRAAGTVLDASLNVTAQSLFDSKVLAFASALGGLTATFFGTAPAVVASRSSPVDAIKAHDRRAGSGTFKTLGLFVVVQLTLSTVLVVVTGLFVGTYIRLSAAPLGFDAERLLVIDVQAAAPDESVDPLALHERLLNAARNAHGVTAAAASILTPLSAASNSLYAEQRDIVLQNAISPGWFRTYGMRFHAGRDFDGRDTAQGRRVAIVNEAYVRKHLADRPPLGAMVDGHTIVGVVEDAVFSTVRAGMRPTMYEPLAQREAGRGRGISISVRSAPDVGSESLQHLRTGLMGVSPDLTFAMRPISDDAARSTRQERLLGSVGAVFAVLALALSAIGLYGLMSQAVAKRRTELGIRLALGARRLHIIRLVTGRAVGLIAVGILAGGLVSFWLSRYVQALFYGVDAGDTATFAVAVALLTGAGLIAAWGPARDVLRLDPAQTLRDY